MATPLSSTTRSMIPAPLIWLLLGLACLAVEWFGAEWEGLMAAAFAALGVSVLTALMPTVTAGLQLLLFGAATTGVLALLQRWSRQRSRRILASDSSERATVISGFNNDESTGRVRWQGQSWAATNLDPEKPLAVGDSVTVMGREGTQLQILGDGQRF